MEWREKWGGGEGEEKSGEGKGVDGFLTFFFFFN